MTIRGALAVAAVGLLTLSAAACGDDDDGGSGHDDDDRGDDDGVDRRHVRR